MTTRMIDSERIRPQGQPIHTLALLQRGRAYRVTYGPSHTDDGHLVMTQSESLPATEFVFRILRADADFKGELLV